MAQHVDPNRWRGTVRGRLLVVALGFLVWVLAIQARLVVVQVVQRQHWVEMANSHCRSRVSSRLVTSHSASGSQCQGARHKKWSEVYR